MSAWGNLLKAHPATQKEVDGKWSGRKPGKSLRCYLCARFIVVGDVWRFVMGTSHGIINFKVCGECDHGTDDELREKFQELDRLTWWKDDPIEF